MSDGDGEEAMSKTPLEVVIENRELRKDCT